MLLLLLLFFFFFFRSLADQKQPKAHKKSLDLYKAMTGLFLFPPRCDATRHDTTRHDTKTRREAATTSPALLQRSATASDDARACDGKTSSPPAAKGNNTLWESQCNNGDPPRVATPPLPYPSARLFCPVQRFATSSQLSNPLPKIPPQLLTLTFYTAARAEFRPQLFISTF